MWDRSQVTHAYNLVRVCQLLAGWLFYIHVGSVEAKEVPQAMNILSTEYNHFLTAVTNVLGKQLPSDKIVCGLAPGIFCILIGTL